MTKEILGVYEYQGISKINPLLNDKENIVYTAFHELMHKYLTEDTSYGDFVTHIELLSKVMKEYSQSADVLKYRMIDMQECIAYCLENIYLKKNKKIHDFKVDLKKMKKENRLNFNLMNKLDYLIDFEYKSEDDYIDIINLVKIMGITALSFAFPEIKIIQLKSPNKLKAYLEKHEINPNQKFFNINKFVKNEFSKKTPIISIIDGIFKNFSPEYNGWKENFRHTLSHDDRYSELTTTHPIVFENLNKITLYNPKTDKQTNLIENTLELDFVHAGSVKDYKNKKVDFTEFLKIVKEHKGSLYIYATYTRKTKNTVQYAISFKSLSQEMNFTVKDIDENKLHKIIGEIHMWNGVVATPFAYDYYQEKLMKLKKKLDRNLYIYFDIPYAYSRILLKEMLQEDVVYSSFYIEYPNFYLLVIQINKNHIFLVPIMTLSTISLQNDLNNNLFNLTFIDTDEAFRSGKISNDVMEVIDSIVNATLNISFTSK